jgi:hypothetical protein
LALGGDIVALTAKQEQFCKNIVSGMDNITSYMNAYDCQSKSAASIESTKLLKRDDITARIKTLNKPIINYFENVTISARQQQIEFIQERIQACLEKDDEQSVIRYTEMLNKIYTLYRDAETETKQQSSVAKVDTDTLKRLVV